ncbi:MAG: choice-of-anchor A family protein [Gammaproteobacteria bacterium]|nr:MAG: choice-of-anchor A family protein [Gammaproteobacteria bacterium]
MKFLKLFNKRKSSLIALVVLLFSMQSEAIELISNLGGTSGYGQLAMSPNDDGSSGLIDVSATFSKGVNFFGQSYKNIYVNNNGNITFKAPVGVYTPTPFPISQQPMIAPFWGDVDTRGGVPSGLPPASNNVYYSSAKAGNFIVTWFNVGYYSGAINKINSFQLVLTDRQDTGEGNIDVEFRYNRLEWTTGSASGGTNGLGGTPAQVGFDAGDRENFFAHPDSRTEKVLELIESSNVGIPGVWRFEFRAGKVIEPPRNILKNVSAKLYLPATGVTVNSSSFTEAPHSNSVVDDKRVIEWKYDTMSATQAADLSFNIVLNGPTPGEQRKIVYKMTLDYIDVNSVPVHSELDEQVITVLASQFDTDFGTDKNNYGADENVNFISVIRNTGAAFGNATAFITVLDAQGNVVASLPGQPIKNLLSQGSVALSTLWNTAVTVTGNYSAVVKVVDDLSGNQSSAITFFTISASGDAGSNVAVLSIRASTDKVNYLPYDTVAIENFIRNETKNAVSSGATLIVQVYAPDGSSIFDKTETLPDIVAKGFEQRFQSLVLKNAKDGLYTVVAQLRDKQGGSIVFGRTQFNITHDVIDDIRGSVTSLVPEIEKGKQQQCEFTVSNVGSNTLNSINITRSLVSLDSQAVVETWGDTIDVIAGSNSKKTAQFSTSNYLLGTYACVLQATTNGVLHNLATSLFKVVAPKVVLKGNISVGDKGRLLVLIDGSSNPSEENYLKQLLTINGWNFTIVKSSSDFYVQLVRGGYTVYAILSENVSLDTATQSTLKAQVALGDGLIVAGSTDRRHQSLEEALGIRARANQAFAQAVGLNQSLVSEPWESAFNASSRVLNFTPSGATVIGDYRNNITGADINRPLGALGAAAGFNAFIFDDFASTSSAVEGRLAVGGKLNINNFGIGNKLDPGKLSDVVVVGGDAIFPSGKVYFGNLIAGGNVSGVGSAVKNGMAQGASVKGAVQPLPFDFAGEKEYLQELSTNIAALPSTGTYTFQYGIYTVKGNCTSMIQVFTIKTADLAATNTLNNSCIPTGATVIFNVTGNAATLQNMGMQSLINLREKVLFNFPTATQINMTSVGIEGSILAPNAQFYNPSGSINGRLIAKSWGSTNNGWVGINNVNFTGDLSAAMGASTKNAVAQYQFRQGKTTFVGFDLLAQALASQNKILPNDTNYFAQLLTRSLLHIQPEVVNARAGKSIPIVVDVENAGSQLVNGKTKIILNSNLKMIEFAGFSLSADRAEWVSPFSLSPTNHQTQTLYIQLPATVGDTSNIKLIIQTGNEPSVVNQFEKTLLLKAQ